MSLTCSVALTKIMDILEHLACDMIRTSLFEIMSPHNASGDNLHKRINTIIDCS